MNLVVAYLKWLISGRTRAQVHLTIDGVDPARVTLTAESWARLMKRYRYFRSLGYR
jgi:hypothetical protein